LRLGSGLDDRSDRRDRPRDRGRLVAAANGHAHPLILDLHLGDAALLHDPHELADPLRARRVDVARE